MAGSDTVLDMTQMSTATGLNNTLELIVEHRTILDLILPILNEAQTQGPNKVNLNLICKEFERCDPRLFPRILFRAYVPVFTAPRTSSPFVRNLQKFLLATIDALDKHSAGGGKNRKFSISMIRCCIKHHGDERVAVRSSITLLCAELVGLEGTLAELNERMLNKLQELFHTRLKDRQSQVRNFSVLGLSEIVSKLGINSPKITKDLMHHLQYDPNPGVRHCIVRNLKMTESSKCIILERLADTHPLVRRMTVDVVSSHPMDYFEIDERERAIELSLTDSSNLVQKAGGILVKKWIESCENNIFKFLGLLDVDTNPKLCYLALGSIFPDGKDWEEGIKTVDQTLWEEKLLKVEHLNEETSFFWKYIVRKYWDEPALLELFLPSIQSLILYINRYMELFEERFMSHGSLVLEQLLNILFISTTRMEEGGRREICQFIETAFDFEYLVRCQVDPLMKLFRRANISDLDEKFFSLIQAMLEKSRELESVSPPPVVPPVPNIQQSVSTTAAGSTCPAWSDIEIRSAKLDIAKLLHEKHKLIREMDKAVLVNDFLKAHEFQQDIDELIARANDLRLELEEKSKPVEVASSTSVPPPTNEMELSQHSESVIREQTMEDYPPLGLEIAFEAFYDHIRYEGKISPLARAFYDNIVIKSITCGSVDVREAVFKCMGMVALLNPADAKKSMAFCVQGFIYDDEKIQIICYTIMFDLVLRYGFDLFEEGRINQIVSDNLEIDSMSQSLLEDDVPTLRLLLFHRLQSDNSDFISIGVQGIMKLLLSRRHSSSKSLIRLLLIWANPVYDGTRMSRQITMWFPIYVGLGLTQALAVADVYIPTLQKILYAGENSALSDASPEKLSGFITSITRAEALGEQIKNAVEVHHRLAINLLDEMLRLGPCHELSILAKGLKFISLRGINGTSIRKLSRKVNRLVKLSGNRAVKQSLKSFFNYLNSEMLFVENNGLNANDTETECSSEENSIDEEDSNDRLHTSNAHTPNRHEQQD